MGKTTRALVILTAGFGLSSTALAQDAVYTGTWSNMGSGVNSVGDEVYPGHSFFDDSVWVETTWGATTHNSTKYSVPDSNGDYTAWTAAPYLLQSSSGCAISGPMVSDDGLTLYTNAASYNCNRAQWGGGVAQFVWSFERASTSDSWSTATITQIGERVNYDYSGLTTPTSYDGKTFFYSNLVYDSVAVTAFRVGTRDGNLAHTMRESADHLELYFTAYGSDGVPDAYRRTRTSTSTAWNDPDLPEELIVEGARGVAPLSDGRLVISTNLWGGYGGWDLFISDEVIPSNGDEVLDGDGDGIEDGVDNCPADANVGQADEDGDGLGDTCDTCYGDNTSEDGDGDGYCGDVDNCPVDANADQADTDEDTIGDVCEADTDKDGFIDDLDNCPSDANPDQGDSDGDLQGDVCDADDDDDGVTDDNDNCPLLSNVDQSDTDGDLQGDECDGDDDGDGVLDQDDLCASTPLDLLTDSNGCSGVQYVELQCPADNNTNHGKHQSCVTAAAKDAKGLGLLTQKEFSVLVSTAAKNKSSATTTTTTTYSGPTASNVDTSTPTSVDIAVSDTGTVTDVTLQVELTGGASFAREIEISLIHDNTTVVVHNAVDNPECPSTCPPFVSGTINATFDDEATAVVTQPPADRGTGVTVDVTGTVQPEEALSAFDGTNLSGTWTLSLVDPGAWPLDGENVASWSLVITSEQ